MTAPANQAYTPRQALIFVLAFGIVSLFADMSYEGMRGIAGPFLASLGATGLAVGVIAGTGELAGYLLRLFSGRFADSSRAYWPITLTGYVVQMAAVPMMALAGKWWVAALLIIVERAGKAIRNPPRDAMLSRAGETIGHGWAFGLHEALDQAGAMAGPLIAFAVLALHGDYREAFAWLALPSLTTVALVFAMRFRFGALGKIVRPQNQAPDQPLPRAFWFYAAAAALTAFGFADFTLMSFHFGKAGIMGGAAIALFYSAAMAADGVASLVFGRWFDKAGLKVVYGGIALGILVPPLAFFGGWWGAALGTLAWGACLGVHEAVMSAAVASLVPLHARARAYGLFTALFGTAWFLGSAVLGALYDVSLIALVAVAVLSQLAAAIPLARAVALNLAAKTPAPDPAGG
ncbi:MAG: MFS transporter [Rhizomicrobium sp.]|nr:MFS transporter [Rhizomicrobium sp.]